MTLNEPLKTIAENHAAWNQFTRHLRGMAFRGKIADEWWIFVCTNDLGTPYFVRPIKVPMHGNTHVTKQYTVREFDARWLIDTVDLVTNGKLCHIQKKCRRIRPSP
jgi:hypothetical protein